MIPPSSILQEPFNRHPISRRRALAVAATALGAGFVHQNASADGRRNFRLTTFQVDITPPLGHPLLGGNFAPARSIADPLYAKGLVLLGDGPPVVLVAVDWCEIRNDAYAAWREALAAAAGTKFERVLVTSVHQHDAPYADLTAQQLLDEQHAGRICDPEFHRQTVRRVADALAKAIPRAEPITHLGLGQAKIEGVASNRRVVLPSGKVTFGRYSTTRDATMQNLPEGLIDPWLKTISFWDGDRAVAAISSYATHPMSTYGRGAVSADFVGLARSRRQKDDPQVAQLYVTGCSGDVTAGKFNDGSPEVRTQLADRLYEGMVSAWKSTKRYPLETVACRAVPMVLPFWETPALSEPALRAEIADRSAPLLKRAMAALGLSSRLRHADGHHIDLQVLDLGRVQLVLLPAESFVEYQLLAQRLRPNSFVMAVGFGECAPGYMPTEEAIREGFREEHGYCWVGDRTQQIIAAKLAEALEVKP